MGVKWVFGTAAYAQGKKAADGLRRGSFQTDRLGRCGQTAKVSLMGFLLLLF